MKINKKQLQTALERVKPGLAQKELIEQSTCFAFMGNRVITYNDEISVSHPVDELDINGAVKAEILYGFLNKVKKDEIEIDYVENQITITAGNSKAGLVFAQEVKLPIEEIGEIQTWEDVPEEFISAIKLCSHCCSKDMTRPVLTCLNVTKDAIEASDSFQIIRHKLSEFLGEPFLFPASSANILVKYKITKIAKGKPGWVHFSTDDGTVFSTRIFHGDYPNIQRHLQMEESVVVEFPKKIIEALERAFVFTSPGMVENSRLVKITIKDGQMKISAKDEFGWFEETLRNKYKGEEIIFEIGVEFLLDLLKHSNNCEYTEGRIKFQSDSWEHIIATINPEG